MKKEHRFTVVVKTNISRRDAWLAVLTAFAGRQPDYCEFRLLEKKPKKLRIPRRRVSRR